MNVLNVFMFEITFRHGILDLTRKYKIPMPRLSKFERIFSNKCLFDLKETTELSGIDRKFAYVQGNFRHQNQIESLNHGRQIFELKNVRFDLRKLNYIEFCTEKIANLVLFSIYLS